LIDHLRTEKTLLVVDNCEHLIEGAAQLIDVLLHACPHVRVLATSREALRISGEADWRVPSLAVPVANPNAAVEDIAAVESVRLFAERGRAVRTDFGVTSQNAGAVVQICRRLDGLPLAIELAASQVKVLPLEQIAAGLDQRFRLLTAGSRTALPRHQTLAAMVAWSYDLLTTSAQALFNRLSVFAGGFTLDAAMAVCGSSENVIAPLSELVSKSMVIADGGEDGVERYHLLETLRQYGRERLVAAGEAEIIQQCHAGYYLHMAEETKPHLFRPEQLHHLARLDRERDDFRAAFRWFVDREQAEAGLRLAAALEFYFWYRGMDETEGQSWRMQLLSLPVTISPSGARANALLWAAITSMDWDDQARARRQFRDALAMARQAGDQRTLAWAMHRVSRYGGTEQEKWYGASDLDMAEGAFTLYRAAGDRWGMAIAQTWLGYLEYRRGNAESARNLLAEALATARALQERHAIAFALRNRGEATSAQNPAAAESDLCESLRLYREVSDIQGEAYIELLLGRLDSFRQRYSTASEHYKKSLRLYQEVSAKEYMVQCLAGLAIVAVGQEQPRRAICLAAAGARLGVWNIPAACPIEPVDLDPTLTMARAQLADDDVAAAVAKGQAMNLEQAAAEALHDRT
jgi:predicted ATPase